MPSVKSESSSDIRLLSVLTEKKLIPSSARPASLGTVCARKHPRIWVLYIYQTVTKIQMICTHVCLYVIQMQLLIILNVHHSLEVYCTYFNILKKSKLLHCWILVVLQILCLTVCIVVYQTLSNPIYNHCLLTNLN